MKQGFPLGPALYVLVIEALSYLLCSKVNLGLIWWITIPKPETGQQVNGHFANGSFLTILEDQTYWVHTMECMDTFCVALGFNI